jgi:hypothetical protein
MSHFLWELLPLADFVTDFLVENPDVVVLLGAPIQGLDLLLHLWKPCVGHGVNHVMASRRAASYTVPTTPAPPQLYARCTSIVAASRPHDRIALTVAQVWD